MASRLMRTRADSVVLPASAVPDVAVRLVGALLALAIAAVHIADQGGMTAFASPDWMGWGYRMVEVGGVLTALTLLLVPLAPPPSRSSRPSWSALARPLGWAAGVLLGAGPFLAYVLSRTVGMPGDPGDVGNWGYWVGTVSLLLEAALVALSVSMLLAMRHSGGRQEAGSHRSEMRSLSKMRALIAFRQFRPLADPSPPDEGPPAVYANYPRRVILAARASRQVYLPSLASSPWMIPACLEAAAPQTDLTAASIGERS
jgi:hypothetical protein